MPAAMPDAQEAVQYRQYGDEDDLSLVMALIDAELSEPYSIFTYRYFINNWRQLCFLAFADGRCVGAVVCKLDTHRGTRRGYIAMLVVDTPYRKFRIGTELVRRALCAMSDDGADEVVLEAEATNAGALRLYAGLGFIRDKRLARYYLSGTDAYRLKLLLPAAEERGAPAAVTAAAAAAASEGGTTGSA